MCHLCDVTLIHKTLIYRDYQTLRHYPYKTIQSNDNLKNTSLAAPGALAHRLQRRAACNATPPAKSKMAARGRQNGRRGLERCLPLGFWMFRKTSFLIRATEGKKWEKRGGNRGKKEKTDDYSGLYVIASSQPLERRPLECCTLVPISKLDK